MSALAFDFTYDEATRRDDGVAPAPLARRRLYALRGTLDEPRGGGLALAAPPAPTLDAMLGGAWSALATGYATCPVCHEETMTARWTAGHGLGGGRCASCGSTLD
jgi:hypothetical protein